MCDHPTNKRDDKGIKLLYKRVMKFLEHPFYAAVAASLFVSLILGVFSHFLSIKTLDEKVDKIGNDIQNNINDIQNNINESVSTAIEAEVSSIRVDMESIQNSFNAEIESIKNDINNINNINIVINQTSDLANAIKETYSSDNTVYKASGKRVVSNLKKVAGTDINTGKEYTTEDLYNETINFRYENEKGEDVFFKGQYDENGYWYGNCIINRYKDEKLTMIMDAVYESGDLISYKQIFPYTNISGNDVWVFSQRKVLENDTRSGETFMYFRTDDYIKSFDNESASIINIINAEEFKAFMDLPIEGYYNGYTSDGRYNNKSQDAYIVKYKENGDVRYLYVGAVKDGVANDDSGEAWCLSWGYANDGYHYYKGRFLDGEPKGTTKDWLEPVTQERIDSIVNPNDFECSLQGLVSEKL